MKKLLVFLVLKKVAFFAILFLPVFASAAPAYSAKMGQAISGVMEHKAIQRGFAANDPRFGAAVSATAAVLTTAATGVFAAAGAPLWVTIGLGALAAGAVSLALDAAVSWYFNEDGTVTYTLGTGGAGNYGQLTAGSPFWSTCSSGFGNQGCYNAATPAGAAQGYWMAITWGSGSYQNWGPPYSQCEIVSSTGAQCWDPNNKQGSLQNLYLHQNSPYSCDPGFSFSGGTCQTLTAPDAPPAGQQTKTAELAADDLTPEQKAAPVNPQIIADTVNQAWQQAAAQPGYQGLPYSYTDPVTASDVEAWRASNPSSYPTVGDAVSPAINPSTGTVTLPQPGAGTSPVPGTQPGIPTAPEGSPQLDLGLDPGIGSPNLEATPTGAQILAPITALFPDLRNFQVPAHQAECPRPVFDLAVIGQQVQMDAHCSLSEDVRGPLYNASLLGWVLAALFIVLSA